MATLSAMRRLRPAMVEVLLAAVITGLWVATLIGQTNGQTNGRTDWATTLGVIAVVYLTPRAKSSGRRSPSRHC